MKKLNSILSLTISIILLFTIHTSCTNHAESNECETIKLKPVSTRQRMSQFISDIKYVKLSTPEIIPIGSIQEVVKYNNLYFIRHTPTNETVSVFDEKGEFLCNIGKKGRGPGEYTWLRNFAIDEKRGEIMLFNTNANEILYYKLNGEYLRSRNVPINAFEFKYHNGNYIFYTGGMHNEILNKDITDLYSIYVYDENFALIDKHLKITNEFMGVSNGCLPSSIPTSANGWNILAPLWYHIYHLSTNGKLTTRYYLDFGSLKCNIKEELLKDKGLITSFFLRLKKTGATYYPTYFFEMNDYLFFDFTSKEQYYTVFYDKINKVPYVSETSPVNDVTDAGFGKAVGKDQNCLITAVEPSNIMDDNGNFPEKLKHLKLTANSNPILAIYKMKE